ncbi:hypothetical protein [Morganella morganii]|uniref:hypothetical protein n=1 Tax=Morganella morganii TaxID=582 RepID=UPI000F478B75|nr:hypothetical protein [Morganella morganii]ROJ32371.1 hypothetical protein BFD15_09595 [Morganella morganii]
MSVNKEYQIVNLMRVTLSIIFWLVVLFLIMKFLCDSGSESVAKFSAFFTSISSLGIAATIWVYHKQVTIKKEDEERELNSCVAIYQNELDSNTFDIIDRVNKITDDVCLLYNLTFDENITELIDKITYLNSNSIKIQVTIPSIYGYTRNINLPLIAKIKPELFIQIVRESSYIESIIKNFSELKSEISKGEKANNLEIYGYLNDICKSNNWLREAVEGNRYA